MMTPSSARLVLGPLLSYVSDDEATVWVETDRACMVEVLGCSSATFCVAGHHYGFVCVSGLESGACVPYQVRLDGERCWPLAASPFPPSVIRTRTRGQPVRLAFGSCRVTLPHEPPYTLSKDRDDRGRGVDALVHPRADRSRRRPRDRRARAVVRRLSRGVGRLTCGVAWGLEGIHGEVGPHWRGARPDFRGSTDPGSRDVRRAARRFDRRPRGCRAAGLRLLTHERWSGRCLGAGCRRAGPRDAPGLARTLRDAQPQARLVVFDLRDLAFMDCCGAHASISARQLGRRLVLLRGPPNVGRVFTLTGSFDAVEFTDLDAGRAAGPSAPATRRSGSGSMSASAPLRAAAETVPSVHETSPRVAPGLVFGVPRAALGVGGWLARGGSLHVTTVAFVSLAMVAGVVIAAAIVDQRNAPADGARQGWLAAAVLTVGSVVSRGMAKSGRRDRYAEDR